MTKRRQDMMKCDVMVKLKDRKYFYNSETQVMDMLHEDIDTRNGGERLKLKETKYYGM